MGRHRQFDVDEVLDAALCVFWRKGYEGASYSDLTAATGVERPALYAAFGNKEALFLKALDRYYAHYMEFLPAALEKPTSREVAEHLLRSAADLNTRYPKNTGCLGINGALAVSDSAEPIRRALIDARASVEVLFRERFERAKHEGDLPQCTDCSGLAAFITAVLHGMAVQAKAGAAREILDAVVEQALSNWPTRGKAG